ncbi:hypothetical protein Scep_028557 [Stephania cephalantha]|uniref:Uncharacterized protein n=1 Tax=Stephania cephalantha TaxID=152367 RepID=A0AAP0HNJ5_9MAGN
MTLQRFEKDIHWEMRFHSLLNLKSLELDTTIEEFGIILSKCSSIETLLLYSCSAKVRSKLYFRLHFVNIIYIVAHLPLSFTEFLTNRRRMKQTLCCQNCAPSTISSMLMLENSVVPKLSSNS